MNPANYQKRAPFFAKRIEPGGISIAGTRDDIKAELRYAANAHIAFWIFIWFPAGHPMHRAWEFYDEVDDKHGVNWAALIGLNSLANSFPTHEQLLTLFSQNAYEKTAGRPILFILDEPGSTAEANRNLNLLRRRCLGAGLKNPYVITMSGNMLHSQLINDAIRGDAVGAYASAPPIENGPQPYVKLDQFLRRFWTQLASGGTDIVPNGMTGWDRRPRIQEKPPTDASVQAQGVNMSSYFSPGTPEEIGSHVAALRLFTQTSSACRARIATLYSWDECDEGGNVLCPTWTFDGPDTRILDAVAHALS